MTIMPSRPKPRINWVFFFFNFSKKKKISEINTKQTEFGGRVLLEMVGQDEQLIIKIE